MPHARQQLRDAVATAVTGLALTGARVFTARVYDLAENQLPCLEVNTVDESGDETTWHAGGVRERTVTIEIVARAQAASGLANTLDTICEQVEVALGDALTVTGKPVDLTYQSTAISFGGDGAQPVGSATLRYLATLYTAANAPGTLING